MRLAPLAVPTTALQEKHEHAHAWPAQARHLYPESQLPWISSQKPRSRKLDKIVDVGVRKVDFASGRANEGWVKAEPALRPRRFALVHGALNTYKNELARRAALARSCLMQPAMQITRKIDGRADRGALHMLIIRWMT